MIFTYFDFYSKKDFEFNKTHPSHFYNHYNVLHHYWVLSVFQEVVQTPMKCYHALNLLVPNTDRSDLLNKVLHVFIPQGILELQAIKFERTKKVRVRKAKW